jgi:predicted amidophosphoribosyltransferase
VTPTIFGNPLADHIRFRKIDALTLPDHTRLTAEDVCLFLIEKTSHRDYSFSPANQLIANIKRNPATSSPGALRHKNQDMKKCSMALKHALNGDWLQDAVLIPVPPSKAINHPEYDDRMETICRQIGPEVDVRNLVKQNASMVASHERAPGERPTVEELLAVYSIEENLVNGDPKYIGIVDDVLTAGTHYRAMHTILSNRFTNAKIAGIFVARRIFPDDQGAGF